MTKPLINLTRRSLVATALAFTAGPSFATKAKEIIWDDLIPPGLPYGQIIGEGYINYETDTWRPIYDENGTALNAQLKGQMIRIPGYIIPMDFSSKGVSSFILVPYVGACIHTPPPPPNQLILVDTPKPWPNDQLWDPVWVTGAMTLAMTTTEVAETGYYINAKKIEKYTW